jgi:general secretion pathway protein K
MSTRGFVLASVLWLLAGLTVVAAVVGRFGLGQAQQAQLLRLRTAAETGFVSTQTQALVLLATTVAVRGGRSGASELMQVDSTTYRGAGGTLIRVQDARGLINLNLADELTLVKLFEVCGANKDEAQRAASSLQDYIDTDSFSRLNGAEREAYEQAGKVGPRNAPLEDPQELWQVLGMPELRTRWTDAGCDAAISVASEGGRNFRTAPRVALITWGVSEGVADVLSARDQQADVGAANIAGGQRERFDTESNIFSISGTQFPGRTYRIEQFDPASGLLWEYWIRLNTDRAPAPWLIQSRRSLTPLAAARQAWPTEPSRIAGLPLLPVFTPAVSTQIDAAPLNLPFGR